MNQDKSARYHTLKRRAAVLSFAWSASFLLALAATPASLLIASAAEFLASRPALPPALSGTAAVIIYVAVVGLLHEAGSLPISFYRGYLLEHRYGLSNETLRGWIWDGIKSGAIGAALSFAGFSLLYLAMPRWPAAWWAIAAAGFTLFAILMARLAPVLLLPLFFTIKPLAREDLRRRLVELSRRAGVAVTDACEWRLSDRTKKGNAALAGLGRTRRILVSDTLLASHTDDEIEAVLAHELGHQVHHDIWKGLLLESGVAFLGFFLASRVMIALAPRLGWRDAADIAGIPVLLLTGGLLSVLLLPAVNAFSRGLERAADRFSFEMTGNAAAFASAMQRLASQNLAEERPSPLALWLFYSHPPVEERVAAAREWEARRI